MNYRLGESVRVATVRVHVANRSWGATVAKENQELVDAFGIANVETIFS